MMLGFPDNLDSLMLWGTTKPHGPHSRLGWPAGLTCIFPEDSSISGAFGLPLAGSQMLGCGFDFCGASCKAPRPRIPMYRCGKFPRLSKRLNSAERASEVQQPVRREERGPGRKGSQREKRALLFTSSFVRASFFFFSPFSSQDPTATGTNLIHVAGSRGNLNPFANILSPDQLGFCTL